MSNQTESPQPQPSRKEELTGKIPEQFIKGMSASGLQVDYLNTYIQFFPFLGQVFKEGKISESADPKTISLLKEHIKDTKTYTEYWSDQIDMYNKNALEQKWIKVDKNSTMTLLVTEQPETETLDSLASMARSLTDLENNHSDQKILEEFIRIAAERKD